MCYGSNDDVGFWFFQSFFGFFLIKKGFVILEDVDYVFDWIQEVQYFIDFVDINVEVLILLNVRGSESIQFNVVNDVCINSGEREC